MTSEIAEGADCVYCTDIVSSAATSTVPVQVPVVAAPVTVGAHADPAPVIRTVKVSTTAPPGAVAHLTLASTILHASGTGYASSLAVVGPDPGMGKWLAVGAPVTPKVSMNQFD